MSKPWAAWSLAALLTTSAVKHFRDPKFYFPVVPKSICTDTNGDFAILSRRDWVALSGAIEVAAAAGLLIPATRKAAATGTAAMFVAFTAGHISQLQQAFGEAGSQAEKTFGVVRLPLQVPLVWLAWRARGQRSGPAS